jgi:hypothetical protein
VSPPARIPEAPIPERVVAIDWSGAKEVSTQRRAICTAVADVDGITAESGLTREQTIDFVEDLEGPVVVGIDMSFGVPAWFASDHDCENIADVWKAAARDGEEWLAPSQPFWRERRTVPAERRFRACEVRLHDSGFAAKSIFQLVGNGQVGAGSIRGMPFLTRLRKAGFAIWPFDPPSDRTVLEIYPTLLRAIMPHDDVEFDNEHERDAVLSAAAMWFHRESFADLSAADDPVTMLEGDVWTPPDLMVPA